MLIMKIVGICILLLMGQPTLAIPSLCQDETLKNDVEEVLVGTPKLDITRASISRSGKIAEGSRVLACMADIDTDKVDLSLVYYIDIEKKNVVRVSYKSQ